MQQRCGEDPGGKTENDMRLGHSGKTPCGVLRQPCCKILRLFSLAAIGRYAQASNTIPPSGAHPPMNDIVTIPTIKPELKIERPRLHKVILVNDDFTPREFVVTVLKAEFRVSGDQA